MKKKLLCICIISILVLAFVACGSKDKESGDSSSDSNSGSEATSQSQGQTIDAEALYDKVAVNMKGIEDAQYDMDMKISSDSGEEEATNIGFKASVEQVGKSIEDAQLKLDMTMTSQGEPLKLKMYYKDGYAYLDMMGSKVKSKMGADELLSAMNAQSVTLLNADKKDVKNFSAEEKNGNTVLQYTINGASATKLLNGTSKDNEQTADTLASMELGDVKIQMTVGKDNYAKSIKASSEISSSTGETTQKMSYEANIEYKKINSGMKINFPEFKDYVNGEI